MLVLLFLNRHRSVNTTLQPERHPFRIPGLYTVTPMIVVVIVRTIVVIPTPVTIATIITTTILTRVRTITQVRLITLVSVALILLLKRQSSDLTVTCEDISPAIGTFWQSHVH